MSNLSFINNLILLKSENKISTYKSRGLDIADFLVFLMTFSIWFEVSMCSHTVIKRMTERFSLISNFSTAASITAVDYSREVLLFGEYVNLNKLPSPEVDIKQPWAYLFLSRASQKSSQTKRWYVAVLVLCIHFILGK